LANLRKTGKMVNSSGPASTPKKIADTPRLARTPTSSLGRAKATKDRKTTSDDTTSDDDDDEESIASPSVNRKRTRTSATRKTYAESDATTGDEEEEFTPKSKKVKTEPVEEEGITDAAGANGPLEEEDEAAVEFV
jgi:hypothetical protein